jgi:hypothetical protein
MAPSHKQHPYTEVEGSVLWRTVEKAISALVKNGDLKEFTAREYIVGYVCQTLAGGKKST